MAVSEAHYRRESIAFVPDRASRIRVLHLGPQPTSTAGMGLSLQRLGRSPLAEHFDMTIISTWWLGLSRVGRVAFFTRALAREARWCLGRGPRVVHVHAAVRGSWYRKAVCIAVAKVLRRPVVLQIRIGVGDMRDFDERIGPLRRRAFRWMFAMPDRVVSVSVAGAKEIAQAWGRDDVEVITNPAPEVVPRAPRTDPASVEILYIGGFRDPAKGWDVLHPALERVLGEEPDVRVALAGPEQPTPEFQRLLAEHARVTWTGWLDHDAKAAAFARADVFVLPSHSEGMPNAMLEAMSNGCGVVATDVGGVPDVLADGVEGIIVPPGDPERLGDALLALVRDPSLRAAYGSAAQARAQRLSGEEVYAKLDAMYRELVA